MLGRETLSFEPVSVPFCRLDTLAESDSILYKRGLDPQVSLRERSRAKAVRETPVSRTSPEDTNMAVPRRKTSPSRRGMRRSADALKKPTYVEDKDSGELRRPHHLDLKTGMYKGRQVLKKKES